MKVTVRIKEELSDGESDYSSDLSTNSSCISLVTSVIQQNGESGVAASGFMDAFHRSMIITYKHVSSPSPHRFTNFDGVVHTGVPTRTTPTLTPTTLRNIEQTFIELTRETERAEPHQNEAGFVPPVVQLVPQGKSTLMSLVNSKAWIGGSTTVTSTQSPTMNRPAVINTIPATQPTPQVQTRRNMGGRRPTKNSGISPEEEERRRIRRERNKLAAARCRKRRLDRTNDLQKETDDLEQRKQSLQNEIQSLQDEKKSLVLLLETHKPHCRLMGVDDPPSPPEVKPIIYLEDNDKVLIQQEESGMTLTSQAKKPLLTDVTMGGKPPRPSSLPVFPSKPAPTTILEVAGVSLNTPSSAIPFNFESLMDGGTGLTPVSGTGLTPMIPSCSTQQRNSSGMDLSSPESSIPPKLITL